MWVNFFLFSYNQQLLLSLGRTIIFHLVAFNQIKLFTNYSVKAGLT